MRERMQGVNFSALVRHLLSDGHTTVSLASEIGVSQPAVSRLASGKQQTLNADSALRLIRLAGGRVEVPEAVPEAVSAQGGE